MAKRKEIQRPKMSASYASSKFYSRGLTDEEIDMQTKFAKKVGIKIYSIDGSFEIKKKDLSKERV